mmetsp:Transcript_31451/g.76120  ORF Transcript_31451/g.76120 Transcript_31451/m.76120 type:complete len:440 (+) Transcript_31451:82-1401(+)
MTPTPTKMRGFCFFFYAVLCIASLCSSSTSTFVEAEQVSNWTAYLESHPTDPETKYRLVFEWDHIHDETIFVDGEDGGRVFNAEDDERCNGDSSVLARDGQPYWMPRFFSRPVSDEITKVTGVKFASPDWQPCGHKEITICHAESHYDFHMYYEDEDFMNSLPLCEIGVPSNPDLPICQDSATLSANHDYFRLVNHSIPLSLSQSAPTLTSTGGVSTTKQLVDTEKDFCVDPTSAVLRSGVHYGDASETLEEWKTPVTIIGSHDCQLKFFEPMFSWKWVSGCVPEEQTSWPVFEVKNIQYTKKGIESLPDSWSVEVSEACRATSCFPGQMDPPTSDVCHIKLVAEGTKCPEETGCTLHRECGTIKDCSTGSTYASPWTGDDDDKNNNDNEGINTISTDPSDLSAEPSGNEDGNSASAASIENLALVLALTLLTFLTRCH